MTYEAEGGRRGSITLHAGDLVMHADTRHRSSTHARNPVWSPLAVWLVYPLFFLAEGLRRLLAGASPPGGPVARRALSVFEEAREQACISISYALMARSMLQPFGRQSRSERRS